MTLNPEQDQALKIADVVADTILAHLKANLFKVSELEMRTFSIAYSAIKLLTALSPELVACAFARAAWTCDATRQAEAALEELEAATESIRTCVAFNGIPKEAN